MSKIGEYFQKNYYPDLDLDTIERHLQKPQVFDTAINFIQQNHYPNIPPQQIKKQVISSGEHPTISLQQQSDDLMKKYQNLNFVKRATVDVGKMSLKQSNGNYATHKMSYSTDESGNNFAFPLVIQQGGKLIDFTDGLDMNDKQQRDIAFQKAEQYAKQSGELIPLGNNNQFAEYFTTAGYKKQMGDDVYNDAFNEYLQNSGTNLSEVVIKP